MEAARKLDTLKTVEDLANLPSGKKAELFNGEIVMMAPASFKHSRLVSGLTSFLWGYCDQIKFDGPKGPESWIVISEAWTYYDPFNTFVHDLAAFKRSEVSLSAKGPVRAKPSWVCEILSPSNWYNDVNLKREMLEKHKVPYYWLVDPERESIQVFSFEKKTSKHYHIHHMCRKEDGEVNLTPFEDLTIDLMKLFGEDEKTLRKKKVKKKKSQH